MAWCQFKDALIFASGGLASLAGSLLLPMASPSPCAVRIRGRVACARAYDVQVAVALLALVACHCVRPYAAIGYCAPAVATTSSTYHDHLPASSPVGASTFTANHQAIDVRTGSSRSSIELQDPRAEDPRIHLAGTFCGRPIDVPLGASCHAPTCTLGASYFSGEGLRLAENVDFWLENADFDKHHDNATAPYALSPRLVYQRGNTCTVAVDFTNMGGTGVGEVVAALGGLAVLLAIARPAPASPPATSTTAPAKNPNLLLRRQSGEAPSLTSAPPAGRRPPPSIASSNLIATCTVFAALITLARLPGASAHAAAQAAIDVPWNAPWFNGTCTGAGAFDISRFSNYGSGRGMRDSCPDRDRILSSGSVATPGDDQGTPLALPPTSTSVDGETTANTTRILIEDAPSQESTTTSSPPLDLASGVPWPARMRTWRLGSCLQRGLPVLPLAMKWVMTGSSRAPLWLALFLAAIVAIPSTITAGATLPCRSTIKASKGSPTSESTITLLTTGVVCPGGEPPSACACAAACLAGQEESPQPPERSIHCSTSLCDIDQKTSRAGCPRPGLRCDHGDGNAVNLIMYVGVSGCAALIATLGLPVYVLLASMSPSHGRPHRRGVKKARPSSTCELVANAAIFAAAAYFLRGAHAITQTDALLAFKNGLTSDPNGALSTWTGTVCGGTAWTGVTCSAAGTDVVAVNRNSQGLAGPLVPEFSALTAMTYLGLWNNALTGTIPAQLSTLASLGALGLDVNVLTGTIPAQLSTMASLSWLNLHTNALTGTIPAQLSTMASLTSLTLHTNALTGTIPAQLSTMASPTRRTLHTNKLVGSIPAELSVLSALSSAWFQVHTNAHLCGTTAAKAPSATTGTALGSTPC
eukprot:CAMPEP_0182865264 /NCGR_PEP_ID=MMETSP0034_2-20130328/7596_1 /TAXON_ID=156128 /ORGANISM="Nephroselmis pyriformis, Strain CCMP717" /LENGTH=870 /DNA_ID=CAMNT_0024997557 /DNA_START=315 /DNA_END=2924 /DNA_ORIENTATION=+